MAIPVQSVVIPCFNEVTLLPCLNSLSRCHPPPEPVEVLVIVNAPEGASREITDINRHASEEATLWAGTHTFPWLHCQILNFPSMPRKDAGAGLARKTGMDIAMQRFRDLDRTDGIISSLDADTLVDRNYLKHIQQLFHDHPECNACTVYFEHPLQGSDFPPDVYRAITQYELHLRYYVQALRYTGFPYAFHTIGSCFSVRASAYSRQGGMNKRKAGEDFYFLQKLMPLGGVCELNSTCVYPSPRPSGRVPFGTGPFINKYIQGKQQEWHTYHPDAFRDIKSFFDKTDLYYQSGHPAIRQVCDSLPAPVRAFISGQVTEKITEINRNSSTSAAFRKRFFAWFNAFKILKFLNFVHEYYYTRVPVSRAVLALPGVIDAKKWETGCEFQQEEVDPEALLKILRGLQKQNEYRI
jgi:hypothetical protein